MFVAHEIAMQLITAIRPSSERRRAAGQGSRRPDAPRRHQRRRQHRRGGRRSGGDWLHAFRIASAEAAEAVTHARIAAAWGHVDAADLAEVLALADRLQAVLWRLRQSRR
ncbi:MAG: hypothetical protein HS111_05310 [Kofleriaceae bacterium]|nr:hypothetical protein [Kofleriaceae bacterium]